MSSQANPVKVYIRVFIALLALLFLTVALAFVPTRHETARNLLTTIGFTIAGTKAVLIILWFMHVKAGTRLTWIFAASAFVWLLIMFALTMNDYMTRKEITNVYQVPTVRAGSMNDAR